MSGELRAKIAELHSLLEMSRGRERAISEENVELREELLRLREQAVKITFTPSTQYSYENGYCDGEKEAVEGICEWLRWIGEREIDELATGVERGEWKKKP